MGFPDGSNSKESACNARDPGSDPRLGRYPGEGKISTLIFLPGEFHGQRSLTDYSAWDWKELDMTKWLTLSLSYICMKYRCIKKKNIDIFKKKVTDI